MRFNLTTLTCPCVAIILATLVSSCLKGPGFLRQGESQALTSLIQTTEEAGDVTGSFSAASNRYQTILASSSSAVSGASVIFPPGALSISTSIIMGEGADAASADVLAQLGLDSSTASGVGSSLYVSASADTDLTVPMSLSLPIFFTGSLFLDNDTSSFAVAYVGIKLETKETSVGLIPNKEITFKDGNAIFETSTWGSYRLVKIIEEAAKPVERVVKPTAEAPPKRNNEVKDRPKMIVTGRSPFVVYPVGKITLRGENLIGMKAFIRDRKLTLEEDSDGKTLVIQLPTTEDLVAITTTDKTPGRKRGMFVIGLGQEGSPGTETNVLILDQVPLTATAFSLNQEAVCARQEFIAGDGNSGRGTGTTNCTGSPAAEPACAAGNLSNCVTSAQWPAVEVARVTAKNLKSGTVLTMASGDVTGVFPSNSEKLVIPTGGGAADISRHSYFKTLPAFGASPTDTQRITLVTDSGEGVYFDMRRAGPTSNGTSGEASTALPVLTPGISDIDRSAENTLYTGFGVAGTGLSPGSSPLIVAGKDIFGVDGTMPPRNYWTKSGDAQSGYKWSDGATGFEWSLVSTTDSAAPANCSAGSAPTMEDLFWALATGMTSGPGAMLNIFPAKLWATTVVSGTQQSQILVFSSKESKPEVRASTVGETALTACVYKPSVSAGNGP